MKAFMFFLIFATFSFFSTAQSSITSNYDVTGYVEASKPMFGPQRDTTQGIVLMVRNFDNPVLETVAVIRIGENINADPSSLDDTYVKKDVYWHLVQYKQVHYSVSLDGKTRIKMFTPIPTYWVLQFYEK